MYRNGLEVERVVLWNRYDLLGVFRVAARRLGCRGAVAGGVSQPGPPPLRSLGLVLHRDGSSAPRRRADPQRAVASALERGVRYLPAEGKYVVTLGHFRGQLDVEECGFFVRSIELATGRIALQRRQRGATRSGVVARLCARRERSALHREARSAFARSARALRSMPRRPSCCSRVEEAGDGRRAALRGCAAQTARSLGQVARPTAIPIATASRQTTMLPAAFPIAAPQRACFDQANASRARNSRTS